jgi:hypothetical protein
MSGLLRTGLHKVTVTVVVGLAATGALVATSAGARATSVPSTAAASPWVGVWKGPVSDPQRGVSHYKVTMRIVTVSSHTVGTDTYSEGLGCGGKLTLLAVSQSALRVRETINQGPSACINGAAITMKPTTNRCVDSWTWTIKGAPSAKGKLTRAGCK